MSCQQFPEFFWAVRLSDMVNPAVLSDLQQGFWRNFQKPLNILEFGADLGQIEPIIDDTQTNYCDFCELALMYEVCRCRRSRNKVARELIGKLALARNLETEIYQCDQKLTNIAAPIVVNERVVACAFSGQILLPGDKEVFQERVQEITADLAPDDRALLQLAADEKLECTQSPSQVSDTQSILNGFAMVVSSLAETDYNARRAGCEKRFHAWVRNLVPPGVFKLRSLYPLLNELCEGIRRFRAIKFVLFLAEGDPSDVIAPVAWSGPDGWAPTRTGIPCHLIADSVSSSAREIVRDGSPCDNQELVTSIQSLLHEPIDVCVLMRADPTPLRRGMWLFINRSDLPICASHFSDNAVEFLEEVVQEVSWRVRVASLVDARDQALLKFAHEVAGPMNSLKGIMEQLRDTSIAQQRRDMLYQDAITECEFAVSLRDTVYDIEADEIKIKPKPTMLFGDVIARCINNIKVLARENRRNTSDIRYEGHQIIPEVRVDPYRIEQIIQNLLSNAVKYAKPGSRECNILVLAEKDSDGYWIRCRDHGIGIDQDEAEGIFLPGVRGRRAHQYDVRGRGFGLTLARKIIEAHGGRLLLTRLQDPTEFSLFLPKSLEV